MTKAEKIFIKYAQQKQTYTKDYNKSSRTFHADDKSPHKKEILNQIAKQVTVVDKFREGIKNKTNATVKTDTVFHYGSKTPKAVTHRLSTGSV